MKKNKKRDYNKLAKLYALIPFITLLIMKVLGTIVRLELALPRTIWADVEAVLGTILFFYYVFGWIIGLVLGVIGIIMSIKAIRKSGEGKLWLVISILNIIFALLTIYDIWIGSIYSFKLVGYFCLTIYLLFLYGVYSVIRKRKWHILVRYLVSILIVVCVSIFIIALPTLLEKLMMHTNLPAVRLLDLSQNIRYLFDTEVSSLFSKHNTMIPLSGHFVVTPTLIFSIFSFFGYMGHEDTLDDILKIEKVPLWIIYTVPFIVGIGLFILMMKIEGMFY